MTNNTPIAQRVENINANVPEATIVLDPDSIDDIAVDGNMLKAFNLSQTVQILAGFDIILSFIYALYNYWFFIPLCIAFIGFQGAKKYDNCCSVVYLIYIILNCVSRLGVFIYIYGNLSPEEKGNHKFDFIIVIFGCIIGIFLANISYKFIKTIDKLSRMQKEYLIVRGIPRSVTRSVFLF